MTELTKKSTPWSWEEPHVTAFNNLKTAVTSAPVLHILDYASAGKLELHTDASAKALGGVLYQEVEGKLKPVAFHSRHFKSAEENYSATDREMLAIVDSLRHFRHYVSGLPITVRTDHAPLQYFFH